MSEGRWVTIKGRRVFIGEGESLSTAMAKSGKFEGEKKNIVDEERFNKFDKMWENTQDKRVVRREYYKNIGYGDKPELVESEVFDKLAKQRDILTRTTNKESYNQLRNGEYEIASLENQMHGSGVYFTYGEGDAQYYKGRGDENSISFNGLLSKDAKVITEKKLAEIRNQIRSTDKMDGKTKNIVLADNGLLASMLGYDAVKVEEKNYMLLLNRKKLILK